jgi:hypothetical protein
METARKRCEQVTFSDAGTEELEQAEADWTAACLNWYDLFLSLGK